MQSIKHSLLLQLLTYSPLKKMRPQMLYYKALEEAESFVCFLIYNDYLNLKLCPDILYHPELTFLNNSAFGAKTYLTKQNAYCSTESQELKEWLDIPHTRVSTQKDLKYWTNWSEEITWTPRNENLCIWNGITISEDLEGNCWVEALLKRAWCLLWKPRWTQPNNKFSMWKM